MPAVDNTIGLQYKPNDTGLTDYIKMMNAVAQTDLVRAHEKLYGAEAESKQGLLPATIEHLKAQTEQAKSMAALNRSQTLDLDPYFSDPSLGMSPSAAPSISGAGGDIRTDPRYASYLTSLEQKHGLPEGYLGKTAQLEYDPRNPVSVAGARGVFQFMPTTAKSYGLTNPDDPIASANAAARLASDNRNALRISLGREPTGQELYLAHNQGARGALAAISNPNASAVNTLGDLAVTQNGGRRDMTNAQFAQLHSGRYDKATVPPSAEAALKDLPEGVNPEVLTRYPTLANTIKAIDEGRMKLSEVPIKQRYQVSRLINIYDPKWDETLWTARNRFQSDLSAGNMGKLVLAVNQLMPHINKADQDAEVLHNSNYPAANTIKNWWKTATGDPAVKKFEQVREVASLDAARLLRGSGAMAEKDIEFWRNSLSSAGSPKQLHEQFTQLADDLIGARVSSIEHQHRMIMGKEPPQLVSTDAQNALAAIKSRTYAEPGSRGSSADVPITAPGGIRKFNPATGLIE